jgi:hypothetical protein
MVRQLEGRLLNLDEALYAREEAFWNWPETDAPAPGKSDR